MIKNLFRTIMTSVSNQKRVGIIGVPFCKGQNKNGVDLAPQVLREAGLIEQLSEIGM